MNQNSNQNKQDKEKQIAEQREYFELLKKISENKKISREVEEGQRQFIISEGSNNDVITQVL